MRGEKKKINFFVNDTATTEIYTLSLHDALPILSRLVDEGNTVIVIEHNLDVIKTADHIIDLGPEGGDEGGHVVGIGTPEEIVSVNGSYTGEFLKKVLAPKY